VSVENLMRLQGQSLPCLACRRCWPVWRRRPVGACTKDWFHNEARFGEFLPSGAEHLIPAWVVAEQIACFTTYRRGNPRVGKQLLQKLARFDDCAGTFVRERHNWYRSVGHGDCIGCFGLSLVLEARKPARMYVGFGHVRHGQVNFGF